ncbi:MAG: cation:proton antiporter subunit C [Pirellulaceae bacterium]
MDLETALGLYNYWVVIFLMMTGFYMVIARRNLIKSVIGLNIFQTSVFLLYITMGKIHGGTAPIVPPDVVKSHSVHHAVTEGGSSTYGPVEHEASGYVLPGPLVAEHLQTDHAPRAIETLVGDEASPRQEILLEGARLAGELDGIVYSNPLPSVLMLTAIVVGIATTALALSLIVRIRVDYGTIDEDKILEMDRLP